MLISLKCHGQIPEGHFLDSDNSTTTGYKIKPFIQVEKNIYHYAVLTELPFDNDCGSNLEQKEWITCSEQNLANLIFSKLHPDVRYKGVIYVYLTVSEQLEKNNVHVESYPESADINEEIKKLVEKLEVKTAKYGNLDVKARLWTRIELE
nr:hypothetical protein [uncultured Allomuricauda sp.]